MHFILGGIYADNIGRSNKHFTLNYGGHDDEIQHRVERQCEISRFTILLLARVVCWQYCPAKNRKGGSGPTPASTRTGGLARTMTGRGLAS